MKKFKGTKGEWVVKHSESKTAYNVVGTDLGEKYKIARCPYIESENILDKQETRANALLIASAPDLLEACQYVLGHIKGVHEIKDGEGYKSAVKLESAINKALGQ